MDKMPRKLSEWRKIRNKAISKKLELKLPPLGLDKTFYLEGKCKCGHAKNEHYWLHDNQNNYTVEDFIKDVGKNYKCEGKHTSFNSKCKFCHDKYYKAKHTDWYLQCEICLCKYYNPPIIGTSRKKHAK